VGGPPDGGLTGPDGGRGGAGGGEPSDGVQAISQGRARRRARCLADSKSGDASKTPRAQPVIRSCQQAWTGRAGGGPGPVRATVWVPDDEPSGSAEPPSATHRVDPW
jgi:hypothetical protein